MRQTTICRQFVYFLSTFCQLFVLFLSWFCLVFVQDLSQQRQKNCHLSRFSGKSFGFVWFLSWKICTSFVFVVFQIFQDKNQTNPKLFPENLDKWQFFCLCCDKSWTKTRQNQDKNKTKSRQNVDKLLTNCRLSHSLAKPSPQLATTSRFVHLYGILRIPVANLGRQRYFWASLDLSFQ